MPEPSSPLRSRRQYIEAEMAYYDAIDAIENLGDAPELVQAADLVKAALVVLQEQFRGDTCP